MSNIVVALIGFASLICVNLLIFYLSRRERHDVADEARDKLDEIHVLVNSRLTTALARIEELSERLDIPVKEEPDGRDS